LDGPKLRLNGAAAQAIGMALHELATNASKYGALSTDAGHVDIAWCADGLFKMNWTEHNGPPVRPPDRRGFGTRVIESMAKQAWCGSARMRDCRRGVPFDVPGGQRAGTPVRLRALRRAAGDEQQNRAGLCRHAN
jgi:two-component sensor histidine kinase